MFGYKHFNAAKTLASLVAASFFFMVIFGFVFFFAATVFSFCMATIFFDTITG